MGAFEGAGESDLTRIRGLGMDTKARLMPCKSSCEIRPPRHTPSGWFDSSGLRVS